MVEIAPAKCFIFIMRIFDTQVIWIDCSAVELGCIANRCAERIEFDIVMETGSIAVTVDDERMIIVTPLGSSKP